METEELAEQEPEEPSDPHSDTQNQPDQAPKQPLQITAKLVNQFEQELRQYLETRPEYADHAQRKPKSKRRKKKARNKESELEQRTEHTVFPCLWKDCSADLHNLATLKKHALKAHGRTIGLDALFHCGWEECNSRPFAHQTDLEQHLDEHFFEVAQVLGDGPSTTLPGNCASIA